MAAATRINAKDGAEMVLIPAGEYVASHLALARTEKQPPPRWLWRRCAETYLAAFLGSYVLPARWLQSTLFMAPLPSGGSRKVRSLALQRQYFYIRGMIEGHRQLGASTKPRAF